MRVTLMAIVMVLALGIGWRAVIVMRVAMMLVSMTVGVKTRGRNILPGMPVNANGRGPSELERNDEHDD